MLRRRIGALLTAVTVSSAVVLTGCSNGMSAAKAEQIKNEVVYSAEDAASIEAMKVSDYSVMMDLYNLYLIQYAYNYGVVADEVTQDSTESAVDTIVAQIQLEMIEYQLALTEKVEVSEETLEEARANAESFYEYFSEEFLSSYGITKDTVYLLFEQQVYINALSEKAITDLSEEYYNQYVDQYAELNFHSVYYALFPSTVYDAEGNATELTGDELAAQKEKAEAFLERAKAGESMEDMVEEYGIGDYSGVERDYDGAYNDTLNQVIAGLEDGDISDIVEVDQGYMIVRMDNKSDEDYKDYMLAYMAYQEAGNLLPTMQEQWMSSAGLSAADLNTDELSKTDLKLAAQKIEAFGLTPSEDETE